MRPVIARIYRNDSWDTFTGDFHQWGLAFEETRETSFNFTIAIIELPTGEIINPLPENVRFTDR
jgi:hypothetical protein